VGPISFDHERNRWVDVRQMISVDVNVLNFSYFYPHKMLGSNLVVGNLTDSEQIVELAVDSLAESYDNYAIAENFNMDSAPSW